MIEHTAKELRSLEETLATLEAEAKFYYSQVLLRSRQPGVELKKAEAMIDVEHTKALRDIAKIECEVRFKKRMFDKLTGDFWAENRSAKQDFEAIKAMNAARIAE